MKTVKKASLKPLITKPSMQGREKLAAFVRERIYGTVTLMAVNIGLLLQTNLTVKHAFITVLATTLGLWLASMFAASMAYRVVHDKNMPRDTLIHEITIHRGLLLAAVPSVIMLSLAGLDVIQLTTALIADISLAFVALTVTILRSAKTSTNSFATAGISIALQGLVAVLIILIKLGAE